MICSGDFVQDWNGRAGIAIEKTSPPEIATYHPFFDWTLTRLPEKTIWWTVALFSGEVTKSPEPLTDSHGRSGNAVLRLAVRCSDPRIRSRISAFLDRKIPDSTCE